MNVSGGVSDVSKVNGSRGIDFIPPTTSLTNLLLNLNKLTKIKKIFSQGPQKLASGSIYPALPPLPILDTLRQLKNSLHTSADKLGFVTNFAVKQENDLKHMVNIMKLYTNRVSTQVPYHPLKYLMAAAIFIRMMSRFGKVTMRYWIKPLTAPPGGEGWS
ncbi:hypothetical protein AVEN_117737-1 [Araneus ventricosus]|uniref:Uncharacterized protein n=1 Tax=Araneus ventricosus TaxID=182803 RepID=A0A4Y2B7E7_ARAVE|nr:hypothetical protein AVEN_117737-1 [Araneus ventricosus]